MQGAVANIPSRVTTGYLPGWVTTSREDKRSPTTHVNEHACATARMRRSDAHLATRSCSTSKTASGVRGATEDDTGATPPAPPVAAAPAWRHRAEAALNKLARSDRAPTTQIKTHMNDTNILVAQSPHANMRQNYQINART